MFEIASEVIYLIISTNEKGALKDSCFTSTNEQKVQILDYGQTIFEVIDSGGLFCLYFIPSDDKKRMMIKKNA